MQYFIGKQDCRTKGVGFFLQIFKEQTFMRCKKAHESAHVFSRVIHSFL